METDSPAPLDVRLDALAPIPSCVGNEVEDLARLVRAWVTALADAAVLAGKAQTPSDPVSDESVRVALERRFRSEFDARAGRLLARAQAAGSLPVWDERVAVLFDLVRLLHAALNHQFAPVDYRHPERSRQAVYRPIALRREIEDELSHIQRLASTIELPESSRLKDLAPTEQAVWDLLEGRALSGKELGGALSPQRGPDAVAKTIARIRDTGRCIERIPGQGYFRPGAPPTPTPRATEPSDWTSTGRPVSRGQPRPTKR